MDVKGTAFLARRSFIAGEHGAARFEEVLAEVATRDRIFAEPIVATTRIPAPAFLRFNDAMLQAFYGNDEQAYFRFGVGSARWALTAGPYKHFVTEKSVPSFVSSVPIIYKSYFTEGEARAEEFAPGRVRSFLTGIQPHHVYFEYAIMGYLGQGLEMVSGRAVAMSVHRGFSRGDPDVHYEFRLGPVKSLARP